MKLGFIGTGNISSDVVSGISKSKINFKKIILSPRNKNKAIILKKKYKKILIAKNNQDVINKSDWVFLGVLPNVGEKILPKLTFKKNQTIISFISTIKYLSLKKILKNDNIFRAIPMPPISIGKGPIAIFPPNKKLKNFFSKIGSVVEIKSEKLSKNFWAISGTMAAFYKLLSTASSWLIRKGVKRKEAQEYVILLYTALANMAMEDKKLDLRKLVANSQTPGGLNMQVVNELSKSKYFKEFENSLNSIYKRL